MLSKLLRSPFRALQSLPPNIQKRAYSPTIPTRSLPIFSSIRPATPRHHLRWFSTKEVTTAPPPSGSTAPASHADQETPLTETLRYFLEPSDFYDILKDKGMDFYCGVPDSLLKDFCAFVTDASPKLKHIITANEGAAVALASGYHLATKKFPIVYMQNSGFGNSVNPLLSLCDPKVYSIPMLLLIGWRGEPGKKDEPQHIVQGKVMSSMLADMSIQFEVLPDYSEGAKEAVEAAVRHMENRKSPYALLVKRQTFTSYKLQNVEPNIYSLNREEALRLITNETQPFDILVATTGFASRELYEIREQRQQDHRREFLTVGSMGHASSIALGVALAKPSRQVITLDGDGALLMHMGSLATIGTLNLANFKHVLINNGSHDSVGGQPTRGFDVDFPAIAKACGYKWVGVASSKEEIIAKFAELRKADGPAFLELRVNKGVRKNLGRPKTSPVQNKIEFMGFLEN